MARFLGRGSDWTVKHGFIAEGESLMQKVNKERQVKSWSAGVDEHRPRNVDFSDYKAAARPTDGTALDMPVKVIVCDSASLQHYVETPRPRDAPPTDSALTPLKAAAPGQLVSPPPGLPGLGRSALLHDTEDDESFIGYTADITPSQKPSYPPGAFQHISPSSDLGYGTRPAACADSSAYVDQTRPPAFMHDVQTSFSNYSLAPFGHPPEQYGIEASVSHGSSHRQHWLEQAQNYDTVELQSRHAAEQCFASARRLKEILASRSMSSDFTRR